MVGGTRQFPSIGQYTGRNLHSTAGSRTALNEDLSIGSVVQMDLDNHGDWLDGFEFGVPTAGKRGPLAVVHHDASKSDLGTRINQINHQSGLVANLRDGGQVGLVTTGLCFARAVANCVAGETLLEAVPGALYLLPHLPSGVLASTVQASASPGTSTAEDTVFSQSIPANSLRAGMEIAFRGFGTVGANATPTLRVRVKLGTTVLLDSGATTTANGDLFAFNGSLKVRTAGASGTLVAGGLIAVGTAAEATNAVEKAAPSVLTSTAVDTTAAQTLTVTVQYGTSHGSNIATLQNFDATVNRQASLFAGPSPAAFAVAAETKNTTSETSPGQQLVRVMIVQNAPF